MLSARRAALPLVLIAAAGISAAVASADPAPFSTPPTPKSYAITTSSIGGITLGMPYASAIAKFGPGSTCGTADSQFVADNPGQTRDVTTDPQQCNWLGGSTSGSASFKTVAGKVTSVTIGAALGSNGEPSAKGVPGKFVLKKGSAKVTVGIAETKLAKAYPKAVQKPQEFDLTTGKRQLIFAITNSKVSSITLQAKK